MNEEGAPIEGAIVTVSPPGENVFASFVRRLGGEAQARTGKDGGFRSRRLRPGDGQRVDVRHDDYAERSIAGISLAAGATRSGVTIVMRRGLALRGVAKDEDGRPLAGVEVTLSATRTLRAGRGGMQMSMIGPGSQVRRETGADGRFEFRGLKAGEYSLAGRRAGLGRASADPVTVTEARAAEPVELVLKPGATVSGVVRDKAGAGASGWYVSARAASQAGGPAFGPGRSAARRPPAPTASSTWKASSPARPTSCRSWGRRPRPAQGRGRGAGGGCDDLVVTGTGQIRGRVAGAEQWPRDP